MGKDEHGIDIDEDTELETADDDDEAEEEIEEEPPEKQPGREDADSVVRETDAEETANPNDYRDEPPKDS